MTTTIRKPVNDFYDLYHEFMEFGWSDSLHFAPLTPAESLEESIVRHQRQMIAKLNVAKGNEGCRRGLRRRRSHAPGCQ